jgi:hypothetical protein
MKRPYKFLTDDIKRDVADLYSRGVTYREISEKHGGLKEKIEEDSKTEKAQKRKEPLW